MMLRNRSSLYLAFSPNLVQTILSLFIVALCQMSGHAQNSWTTPVRIDPITTQFQNSPLIAVGPQRQIAVACSEGFPGAVLVYRSTDNGTTFLRTQLPPPTVFPHEIRGTEALSFDTDGNLYLLWSWNEEPLVGPGQWLVLSKSTDGGVSFSNIWSNAQLFVLNQHKMIITPDRTIHIVRDSLVRPIPPPPQNANKIIYTRFIHGNPANKIEVVLPQPADTVYTRLEADMLLSQNVLHYACYGYTSSVSQLKVYYTRSTDGGGTFATMVVADSALPQFGVSAGEKTVLFGRVLENDLYLKLAARYVIDSTIAFSPRFILGGRWLSSSGTIRLCSSSPQNYLVYGGVDTQTVACYYEYRDLQSPPLDSAFFPLLQSPDFALDSLGGKYLIAGHQREHFLYLTRKDVVSTVGEESERPSNAVLYQNYPNPFNPDTKIQFTLANKQHVKLTVFDVLGRELTRLVDDVRSAGRHAVFWNPSSVSSGVYFYKLHLGESIIATRKMVLIK